MRRLVRGEHRQLLLLMVVAATGSNACADAARAQAYFPGGGTQGYPGAYRVSVGYTGPPLRGIPLGTEPAASQLRGFPLLAAPPTIAGVPGDVAAIYRTPLVPDVTYLGPHSFTAAYREPNRYGRPRLLPTPPGGSGLPLVLYGGFYDNAAPIEFSTPAYPIFSGYLGTVAPVMTNPPPAVPVSP